MINDNNDVLKTDVLKTLATLGDIYRDRIEQDLDQRTLEKRNKLKIPKELDCYGWFGIGTTVTIQGITLSDPLVYVYSKDLNKPKLISPEIIDSTLLISKEENILSFSNTPDYNKFSENERYDYLMWLSQGRNATVAVHFLRLFLSGLERRTLIDMFTDATLEVELESIVDELRRLRSIYKKNSFSYNAGSLIQFLQRHYGTEKLYLRPISEIIDDDYDELNDLFRIGIGQLAEDKQPLPVDWAVAWATRDDRLKRRTAARRCPDQLAQAMCYYYQTYYPDGVKLKKNRYPLKIYYYGVHPNCYYVTSDRLSQLSDLLVTRGLVKKLQEMIDQCTPVIESYSRYIAKNSENPDKLETLEAYLTLPSYLWPQLLQQKVQQLKQKIFNKPLLIPFSEFINQFKLEDSFSFNDLSRNALLKLINGVVQLGISIEPDLNQVGVKLPKENELIVLFMDQSVDHNIAVNVFEPQLDSTNLMQQRYFYLAMVILELSSVIVFVEGNSLEDQYREDLKLLSRQIKSWKQLNLSQQLRLQARLFLLQEQFLLKQELSCLKISTLKKRTELLSDEAKLKIVAYLTSFSLQNGLINSAKVKQLEQLYKLFNIAAQQLYSDLHHNMPVQSIAQLISVDSLFKESSGTHQQLSIEKKKNDNTTANNYKKVATKEFSFDLNRVKQLKKETEQVGDLLTQLFNEEEQKQERHYQDDSESVDSEFGFDQAHQQFFERLISKIQWTRAELQQVADSCDLMLDGALTEINEIMFDHFDEAIAEGDDLIDVHLELLNK